MRRIILACISVIVIYDVTWYEHTPIGFYYPRRCDGPKTVAAEGCWEKIVQEEQREFKSRNGANNFIKRLNSQFLHVDNIRVYDTECK